MIPEGASAKIKDEEGMTPVDWAKKKKHMKMVKFLKKYGAITLGHSNFVVNSEALAGT